MARLHYLPDGKDIEVREGKTILQASLQAGIPHAHVCFGRTRCTTCRVLILEGLEHCNQRNPKEDTVAHQFHYQPETRLACQTTVSGDVKLRRLVTDEHDLALTGQLIVERVRAEVQGMRRPEDLLKVAGVMWEGLHDVGLSADYCAIEIFDRDRTQCETYAVTTGWMEEQYGVAPSIRDLLPGVNVYSTQCRMDESTEVSPEARILTAEGSAKEWDQHQEFLKRSWDLSEIEDVRVPTSWAVVPFSYGCLSLQSFGKKELPPQALRTLEVYADAMSLAYARFLDIRNLEGRNHELQDAYKKLQETQAQLVHSANMAAMGQLVAGVAHELNTPLGALKSNVDVFQRALIKLADFLGEQAGTGENESTRILQHLQKLAGVSVEAVERAGTIVTDLRRFARLDEAEFARVDLHECLDRTQSLLQRQLSNTIRTHKEYGDLPLVDCYPKQLNQAFMNLLINAAQAIEEEGDISIKTTRRNDEIQVEIRDTGKGISEEYLGKIFDPGFTTKGVGVGTGLGLSIVHQIVERHQGRIEVESQVGHGTSFKVWLPVAPKPTGN